MSLVLTPGGKRGAYSVEAPRTPGPRQPDVTLSSIRFPDRPPDAGRSWDGTSRPTGASYQALSTPGDEDTSFAHQDVDSWIATHSATQVGHSTHLPPSTHQPSTPAIRFSRGHPTLFVSARASRLPEVRGSGNLSQSEDPPSLDSF